MTDLAAQLKDEVKGPHPYRRASDAATLILLDRSGATPKVLLGRRHQRHVFMPGKFVFPGGRVEAADRYAKVAAPLDLHAQSKLMQRMPRANPVKARALALAAIRETYEETGLLLGTRDARSGRAGKLLASSAWKAFGEAGVMPDLGAISFVARAITPPGRPRRFDTRFFTADASAIAHRVEGMVGEESELVEIVWIPIDESQHLDLPGITRRVLQELQSRIAAGFSHALPVPFFHTRGSKNFRDTL